MDTTDGNVAGLDVHHKTTPYAVRCQSATGNVLEQSRSFGAMTKQRRALADSLEATGVTHVALESTGLLWKLAWNILEGRFMLLLVLLVNPRHLKKVPGHKTDASDAQWIAQLLQHGLPAEDAQRLDAIPGVNRTTIENVIAEIGPDMNVFPDEHHLSSWTGICPGNEESAGRRLRSTTRHGNRWLRHAPPQAAWAASHAKDNYLAAQYRWLAARRGKNRARLAVRHSILVILFHLLKHHLEHHDLGADCFNRLEPECLRRDLVKRLKALGHEVLLLPRNPNDSFDEQQPFLEAAINRRTPNGYWPRVCLTRATY